CTLLSELLRHWSGQKIEMRWVGMDRLLGALTESAPTGMRDADPVFWLLRLEALRLGNRPDQFDEVAIDYCVTYEVSPPSWERALCRIKLVDASGMSLSSRSAVTDVSTGFAESVMVDEPGGMRTAAVELSGQLVGDIGKTLAALEARLGTASVVNVNCQRLIRMDFVAAGDLLNWVLSRRSENRLVHFDDAHRLLALFFNAMGINEHARVKVRNI
ncbi:MAG TPA: STAS domain-containing protein, partial [Ideonella sp.]